MRRKPTPSPLLKRLPRQVGGDPRARQLIALVQVVPGAAPSPQDAARIREALLKGLQSDMIEGYLMGLQERVGVSVNQAAYNRAIGVDPTTGR